MTYTVELGGKSVSVAVLPHPEGGYRISVDGGPVRHVRAGRIGSAEWWLEDERPRRVVAVHVQGDHVAAQVSGYGVSGTVVDPRSAAASASGGASEGVIRCPMPGAVARVLVKAGDAVHQGQVLVVVEAMKMENEFRSPIDGVVKELLVVVGATVEANAVLAVVA